VDTSGIGKVKVEGEIHGGGRAYLGRLPLQGKCVLEMGTASGFLCFVVARRARQCRQASLSHELASRDQAALDRLARHRAGYNRRPVAPGPRYWNSEGD